MSSESFVTKKANNYGCQGKNMLARPMSDNTVELNSQGKIQLPRQHKCLIPAQRESAS